MKTLKESMLPDLRRRGANILTSLVLDLLLKHTHGAYGCVDQKNFVRDLGDAFEDGGYQILTDELRAMAGLPPRGELGWTAAEMQAWELKRLALMTLPIVVPAGSALGEYLEAYQSMPIVSSIEDITAADK